MSNPSYIGMKKNSAVYYVSCHNGGRLEYNGRTLYEHYTTNEKVKELLSQGNMSYVKEEPEDAQYYKNWKDRSNNNYWHGTYDVDRNRRPKRADGGMPCYLWNGVEWLYSPEDGEVWFPLAAAFESQLRFC